MSHASIGIDVGGTFTDLVAVDAAGAITALKIPSTPGDQSEAVATALGVATGGGMTVSRFVHGTTVATNTLLERNGARVALVATEGFTDLLALGRQDRASLYDLARHHPPPLVERGDIVPARERITPDGVRTALDGEAITAVVAHVRALRPDVVAVALLHAPSDPRHERLIGGALQAAMPGVDIVLSSDVFPEIREYERTTTTVAEGYLRPGVASYLARLSARATECGAPPPGIMTSGGGMRTVDDACLHAASLALSGPAGGVVGAAAALRAAGFSDALTVDIGGTSADVGLVLNGEPLVESGGRIAGVPISLPRVLVETVSAGGGSIGWVDDGGALRVGPHSAGAVPGPAAFGRGGCAATVTDAHVVLGHIAADSLSGGISLDAAAAHEAVGALARRLSAASERVARAMIDIADAAVARAMRRMSVERGVDPRECVLVPFGGGGPLHCCGLAEQLGMSRIFVPPHAGVLSALGLAVTAERREGLLSVLQRADRLGTRELDELLDDAASGVEAGAEWDHRWFARARYAGQGHELDVPVERGQTGAGIAGCFAALHQARNGFALEAPVEIIALRYVASGAPHPVRFERAGASAWRGDRRVDDGGLLDEMLSGGDVVGLAGATLRVAPGWRGASHPGGGWLLRREEAA